MFNQIIDYIQTIYQTEESIPLHAPTFIGKEKEYLTECIDSTFVSSVGTFVDSFEEKIAKFTGSKHAIVTVNGTTALQVALRLAGVAPGDEVITQPLTFVATPNAISYLGATPAFVDVDKNNLSLSPEKLDDFLKKNCEIQSDGHCYNLRNKKRIAACVPMHTFGHPADMTSLLTICGRYHIPIVEDAAESLGSTYQGKHTGTWGRLGILSFNGNKIITTGGGGVVLTNDAELAHKAKYLTTTAKKPHLWEYDHDQIGYNFRMPNINAALGCAQIESLPGFIKSKRVLASNYIHFFRKIGISSIIEPLNSNSNYWLNSIVLNDLQQRDAFLKKSNQAQIMTRPIWKLANELEMYRTSTCGNLENAQWLVERVVCLPSSVPPLRGAN